MGTRMCKKKKKNEPMNGDSSRTNGEQGIPSRLLLSLLSCCHRLRGIGLKLSLNRTRQPIAFTPVSLGCTGVYNPGDTF